MGKLEEIKLKTKMMSKFEMTSLHKIQAVMWDALRNGSSLITKKEEDCFPILSSIHTEIVLSKKNCIIYW